MPLTSTTNDMDCISLSLHFSYPFERISLFTFLTIIWLVVQIVLRMPPSFNFQIRAVMLCSSKASRLKAKATLFFSPSMSLFPPCPMTISGTRGYMETLLRMKHVVKLTSHYLFREEHPQTHNYPAGAATGPIMSYLGQDACEELISHRKSYLYFWKAFMSLSFLRRR